MHQVDLQSSNVVPMVCLWIQLDARQAVSQRLLEFILQEKTVGATCQHDGKSWEDLESFCVEFNGAVKISLESIFSLASFLELRGKSAEEQKL